MKKFIVGILTHTLVGPAAGDDYQPLATGNFWSYFGEYGGNHSSMATTHLRANS